jgi:hypothetical protein
MRAEVVDPERTLFRSEDGAWVWIFALFVENGDTRLLSRNRIATPDASTAGRLGNRWMMEPGSLAMEREMLIGIKEGAEAFAPAVTAASAPVSAADDPAVRLATLPRPNPPHNPAVARR